MSSQPATRLTLSLEALAARSGPNGRARDGWGVAYYEGRDVALFREPRPAAGSPLVELLESGGPATHLAISHIRHATQGDISLANTQPFVREVAGATHTFAHNGDLRGIQASGAFAIRRHSPVGSTDSEHAFCALLERWQAAFGKHAQQPSLGQRLEVVAGFAAELRKLGPANFLYCDGETLFAHGHRRIQPAVGRIEPPGLWMLERQCTAPQPGVECDGVALAPGVQQVVIVASVPLSGEPWRALAEGEVVAIADGRRVGAALP
jgi:glutamine amidotransferase